MRHNDEDRKVLLAAWLVMKSQFFEIALVLVRLDEVAGRIVPHVDRMAEHPYSCCPQRRTTLRISLGGATISGLIDLYQLLVGKFGCCPSVAVLRR